MNSYTFAVTKTINVTVEALSEQDAIDRIISDELDGEYGQSFVETELQLELLEQEPEHGFIVLIRNLDEDDEWERDENFPDTYESAHLAWVAIATFSDRAGDEGFHYPKSDFKVVEVSTFKPPLPVYDNGDCDQIMSCPKCGSRTEFIETGCNTQRHICLNEDCAFQFILEPGDYIS